MPGRNLGDIAPKFIDPLEKYFDLYQQAAMISARKWIVRPDWVPPVIPGMENAQLLLDRHGLPRAWQLLMDFFTTLQKGMYLIKNPNWLEPPLNAVNFDVRTETPVTIAEGASDAAMTELVSFVVPDRHVGTIVKFGHELVDATFWGTVFWSIVINGKPEKRYHNFKQQIGEFVNPTAFPVPIPLKYEDKVQILARTPPGAGTVDATVRAWAYAWSAPNISQDGTYKAYQVKT